MIKEVIDELLAWFQVVVEVEEIFQLLSQEIQMHASHLGLGLAMTSEVPLSH